MTLPNWPTYTPTPTDCSWLRLMMGSTKVGGLIAYPRSCIAYTKTSETSLSFYGNLNRVDCDLPEDVPTPQPDPELQVNDRIATWHTAKACNFEINDPGIWDAMLCGRN